MKRIKLIKQKLMGLLVLVLGILCGIVPYFDEAGLIGIPVGIYCMITKNDVLEIDKPKEESK